MRPRQSADEPARSELMTVPDLAELFGVGESTARRWCASGEVPAVMVGRRWYVPRSRLMEFVGAV